jgi:predicted secreted hydrolase
MVGYCVLKKFIIAIILLSLTGFFDISACASDLSTETLQNVARVLWMYDYDPSEIPKDIQERLNNPANSTQAFGERMLVRLDDLITNPDSWTSDYSPRHKMFKEYSNNLSPHQAYVMTTQLGPTSSRGYQEIPQTKEFRFPEDDCPQYDYQVGWHFFVGSAFTDSGEEYGVQLMFWRYALLPPAMAQMEGLSDLENQILEMHLAISKAGDRHYRSKPYIIAGTTGLINFSPSPYRYELGRNSIRSLQDDTLFPIKLQAWGVDESGEEPVEIEIDITLHQTKGYVLNGDEGLCPSCGGVGTLYYSVPHLLLDPKTSTLGLNGQKISLSGGKFWYDHQYGSGFMPKGNPRNELIRVASALDVREPDGWDWMMLQFDDGTEMSLSSLHKTENAAFYNQTGINPPGTMIASCWGVYIKENGDYESISGSIEVDRWIQSTIHYEPYLATNTWYPNRVKVMVESAFVPEERRQFYLIPIVETGQQGYFASGSQYSEGAVYLETLAGERIGRGFLESTAYADVRKQALVLCGIPTDEYVMDLLNPVTLTQEQKDEYLAFLKKPENAQQVLDELARCRGLF